MGMIQLPFIMARARLVALGLFLWVAFLWVAPGKPAFSQEEPEKPLLKMAVVAPYEDLAEAWAETAGLRLEVREFELEEALRQVAGGKFDLALVPGELSAGQKRLLSLITGTPPIVKTVAWEALTPIVHPDNPIVSLAPGQIQALLADPECASITAEFRLETWADVGVESPLGQEAVEWVLPGANSPSGKFLSGMVLPAGCKVRAGCTSLSADAAIERAVAENPRALGFVHRLRYIGRAKLLPLNIEGSPEAITPNVQSLNAGTYPWGRRITLAASERHYFPDPAALMMDHARSEEGQRDVARTGYFPIR
jgi:ABC-type phosphate transport system substrate-binding protein